VNCAGVRELLPEHALGVGNGDASEIEQHLSWCAACRREARELERAAGMLAFALAPAEPASELQDRVVETVGAAATVARPPATARVRGRRAGIILLAAAVALAGLGTGAVLAHRSGRAAQIASQAQQQNAELARFRQLIQTAAFVDPATEAALGTLEPPHAGTGSGSALTIVSPSQDDQVIVIVTGLRQKAGPYTVMLEAARPGRTLSVARIRRLDSGGGATVARVVSRDLAGFGGVVVRDARGRIVLQGTLGAEAPMSSPSP
jgi:hypothetical protein